MANIVDYLKWRGDVPFEISPFNEVDALVLCELVYSPFEGLVPGPGLKEKISMEDLCDRFFLKFSDEELLKRVALTKLAPFLMKEMAHSKRFGGMKIAGFMNEVDAENQSIELEIHVGNDKESFVSSGIINLKNNNVLMYEE